jgi:peptidoglycan/xylan/chitin deacetylase (PgdA/CDA1 family)
VNPLLSRAVHNMLFSNFIALLERLDGNRPNLLRVLTYHRVDESDAHAAFDPSLTVLPEIFDEQMSYLISNYHVLSMLDLLEVYRTGASLPPRSVMITFDDAYCDFAENAWPILKRYRLPATLFVPTAFPDHPERLFWWDRLYYAVSGTIRRDDLKTPLGRLPMATVAQRRQVFLRLRNYAKTLPHDQVTPWVEQICGELGSGHQAHNMLSWDALRRLAREGVTLGAHTQTHPLMNRISVDEARAEAIGSLRDLEREIGPTLPVFAYPGGGFNDEIVRALEHEGFALAFTTVRGVNDMQTADRLRLRRINVARRTTMSVLRAQLLSWSMHLNRWRPLAGT